MAGQARHSRDTLWFYRFLLNTSIRELESTPGTERVRERISRVEKFLAYQQDSRVANARLGGRPTPDELEGWHEAVEKLWRELVPTGTVPRERRRKLQRSVYHKLDAVLPNLPHEQSVYRLIRQLNGEY